MWHVFLTQWLAREYNRAVYELSNYHLTGMSYARNIVVVKTGRVVIAGGGAFGTLSEIAHALGDGIPTIGLGTWELSREGIETDGIVRVKSPKEAVDKAIEIAHNSRS